MTVTARIVLGMWTTHARSEILKATNLTPRQLNRVTSSLRAQGHSLPERWSVQHPRCLCCKRTDRPHEGLGLCVACYSSFTLAKAKTVEEFINDKPDSPRSSPPVVKKGAPVTVKKWGIDGLCTTDPYDWPRHEIPVCKAVDIRTMASLVEGVPLEMVTAV